MKTRTIEHRTLNMAWVLGYLGIFFCWSAAAQMPPMPDDPSVQGSTVQSSRFNGSGSKGGARQLQLSKLSKVTALRAAALPPAPDTFTLSWPTNLGPVVISRSTELAGWQNIATNSTGKLTVTIAGDTAFFRGAKVARQSVPLVWNANQDAATGYRIYCGVESRSYTNSIDAGNATALTVSNLVEGARYYFAITAYATGQETGFSDEVSYIVPAIPFRLNISRP